MEPFSRWVRIGQLHTRLLKASATLMLVTGCTNVSPVAPGTRAVVLDHQQSCRYFGGEIIFPAGRYEPQFSNAGGIYYRAPSSLILRGPGASAPAPGGLFVPSTSEHRQGFWMESSAQRTVSIEQVVSFSYAP